MSLRSSEASDILLEWTNTFGLAEPASARLGQGIVANVADRRDADAGDLNERLEQMPTTATGDLDEPTLQRLVGGKRSGTGAGDGDSRKHLRETRKERRVCMRKNLGECLKSEVYPQRRAGLADYRLLVSAWPNWWAATARPPLLWNCCRALHRITSRLASGPGLPIPSATFWDIRLRSRRTQNAGICR